MNKDHLSSLEYHVLLSMAAGPLHGYAVKQAVEADSGGAVRPGAGSLYRLFARLINHGLVEEVDPPADAEAHPGLARRYYDLTVKGRRVLSAESQRLRDVATLAAERLGLLDEEQGP